MMEKVEKIYWSQNRQVVEYYPANSIREHLLVAHGMNAVSEDNASELHKVDHASVSRENPMNHLPVKHTH